ncbi:MAG TPA: hypothetical protein VIM88_06940 [Sulfurovum sp.]|uniref:hypothetical protein n=1 Tax=Sulfurovum sp. TaxID=1969726 RepID=UPI002F9575D3
MDDLINETVEISREYFKGFAFEDEQIASLLESGKRDLQKELAKLQTLFESERIDMDAVNLSIHALKGLFLTMGNTSMGEQLSELRQENETERMITETKKLLGC